MKPRIAPVSYPQVKQFTLIELLVVISVIAILAGLLLPALNAARKRALAISCISNLKQAGVVLHLYADDYNGLAPAPRMYDSNTYFKQQGLNQISVSWGMLITHLYFGGVSADLPKLKAFHKKIQCPVLRNDDWTFANTYGMFYRHSGGIGGDYSNGSGYWYAGPVTFQVAVYGMIIRMIKNPSSFGHLGDSYLASTEKPVENLCMNRTDLGKRADYGMVLPGSTSGALALVHSCNANVLMVDGNVTTIGESKIRSINATYGPGTWAWTQFAYIKLGKW